MENQGQEICYRFRDSGDCKFADSCKFSHAADAVDNGGAPRPRRRKRGGGGGGGGLCYNFRDNGECQYGDECRYSHGAVGGDMGGGFVDQGQGGAPQGGFRRRRKDPRIVQECWQFRDKGECEFGDGCKFFHGENDTREIDPRKNNGPCYNWRDNGECSFGDMCRFSHEMNGDMGGGMPVMGGDMGGMGMGMGMGMMGGIDGQPIVQQPYVDQ